MASGGDLMSMARRYRAQLAGAGALVAAYWLYRTRLREPALAQPRVRPEDARALAPPAAAAPAAAAPSPVQGDLKSAWFELQGAVDDSRRHAEFLRQTMAAYERDVTQNPSRAREELSEAVEDANAHAHFVAGQVRAFAELAGLNEAQLGGPLPPPRAHPMAGPASSSKVLK